MPTKKPTRKKTSSAARKPARPTRKTSSTSGGVSAAASAQLKQLRKNVEQLKSRLERETKARATALTAIANGKKAHDVVTGQMKTLRAESARLAKELKRALGEADKRAGSHRQAVDQIAGLRAELKRKSAEVASLAAQANSRIEATVMSEETSNPGSISPTTETESVSAETLQKEESPRESSIEEELHPERKD
jgi:hypothetical protein